MSTQEQAYKIFNKEGRLLQVEYGLEAVYKALPNVAICGKNCIVTVAGLKNKTKLESEQRTSLFKISNGLYMQITGRIADIDYVIRRCVDLAARLCYDYACDVLMPEIFSRELSKVFQKFIQRSGSRSVAFAAVVFGFCGDEPTLYYTDMTASDVRFNAVAYGKKHSEMTKYLESNYVKDLDASEVTKLAIGALFKSIGNDAYSNTIEVNVFTPKDQYKLSENDINKCFEEIVLDTNNQ